MQLSSFLKQRVSNSSPGLNRASELPNRFNLSLVSYQTRFKWSVYVHTHVCAFISFPFFLIPHNSELTGQFNSNLTEAEVSKRLHPKRNGKNTYLIRVGRHCNEGNI